MVFELKTLIFLFFSFIPVIRITKISSCKMLKHLKCINGLYPRSNIQRFPVPENLISWNDKYPEYKPVFYESPVLAGKVWADPGIGS